MAAKSDYTKYARFSYFYCFMLDTMVKHTSNSLTRFLNHFCYTYYILQL